MTTARSGWRCSTRRSRVERVAVPIGELRGRFELIEEIDESVQRMDLGQTHAGEALATMPATEPDEEVREDLADQPAEAVRVACG